MPKKTEFVLEAPSSFCVEQGSFWYEHSYEETEIPVEKGIARVNNWHTRDYLLSMGYNLVPEKRICPVCFEVFKDENRRNTHLATECVVPASVPEPKGKSKRREKIIHGDDNLSDGT